MRVLVTGATGQLGRYLMREAGAVASAVGWSRRGGRGADAVDLLDERATDSAWEEARAGVVIHAAAVSRPAEVCDDPVRARAVNVEATRRLAHRAARDGARFVYLSTDMVFDGAAPPYREDAATCPANAYGRTKLAGERAAMEACGDCAVIRLSLMLGPSLDPDRPTFFDQQVAAFRGGRSVRLFHDEWRTMMSLGGAAGAIVAAARSEIGGVTHLGGPERVSRREAGVRLAAALGADASLIESCSRLDFEAAEARPADLSLESGLFDRHFGTDIAQRGLDMLALCRDYDTIHDNDANYG